VRLKCLGGFGEQGRSALLVEGKSCFLVDYGVKKTVGEGILGELPLKNFPELDFIVVTHAHQDHTAMLPLLVEKGINVPIYATPPTKEFTITYCESWHKNLRQTKHL
jgi:predicted metal-dependent RNase